MLNTKKLFNKILNGVIESGSWSNVSATTGTNNTVQQLTLLPRSKYIVLAGNANGMSGASNNNLNFNCPQADSIIVGAGLNNSGSGNACVGWAFVTTGENAATLNVTSYGYSASEKWSGSVVAFRVGG